jgi:hypothetical protein
MVTVLPGGPEVELKVTWVATLSTCCLILPAEVDVPEAMMG